MATRRATRKRNAEPTKTSRTQRVQPHPLIEAIVSDPARAANIIGVVGFLGESATSGYTRIYTSLEDLSAYFEVRTESICHTRAAADDDVAPTYVWFDESTADLTHPEWTTVEEAPTPDETGASFLGGGIASQYLRPDWMPGGGYEYGGYGVNAWATLGRIFTRIICTRRCPTHGCTPRCPTRGCTPGCPTPGCPTRGCTPGCPRTTPGYSCTLGCPTWGCTPGCPLTVPFACG